MYYQRKKLERQTKDRRWSFHVYVGVKGINELQRRKGSSEGKKDKASFRDVYTHKKTIFNGCLLQ